MKTAAIVPARYASTRFPGKPLADLMGKPIIQWVYEACELSGLFHHVIVATDSVLIEKAVRGFGGRVEHTSASHPSGTDRIAEVALKLEADIILNVQGDEPLITKAALSGLLGAFSDDSVKVASLMTPITEDRDLENPNVVKLVTDSTGNALYFSRFPIPYNRDNTNTTYMRHIGVYAYRRESLLSFVNLPPSPLEQTEKLEQLRLLENGIPIRMVNTDYQGLGIDSPEDLELVKSLIELI